MKNCRILVIGGEQYQRAEPGRADGIAFGHSLGRIADGVERIGRLAHLLRQSRHFSDAAGVVGHRTERIERDDHAGERQHGGHGDRNPEQTGELEGDQDARDDHNGRQRGRFQRNRQPLNDVGAVPGNGGFGDRLHRPEIGAGIVFRDPDDQSGNGKAHNAANEQRGAGIGLAWNRPEADQKIGHQGDAGERKQRR